MELVALALLASLVKKATDMYKMVRSGDREGLGTQTVALLAGVLLVLLFAATPFAAGVAIAGVTLAGAGWATQVVFGLALGAGASVFKDVLKAVDNRQTENVG